jgi:hypothetical protein
MSLHYKGVVSQSQYLERVSIFAFNGDELWFPTYHSSARSKNGGLEVLDSDNSKSHRAVDE